MTFEEAIKAKQKLHMPYYGYLGITFYIYVIPNKRQDFEAMHKAIIAGDTLNDELSQKYATDNKFRLGAFGRMADQIFSDLVDVNGQRETP